MTTESAESCCTPTGHMESAVYFPFESRLHVSINMPSIDDVMGFYMGLLNAKPVKVRDDFAKFELDDPPVNLTLNLHPAELASKELLSLEISDADLLDEYEQRLSKVASKLRRDGDVIYAFDCMGNQWMIRVANK